MKNIKSHLSGGIEKIVKGAMRETLSNPKESLFITGFFFECNKAAKKRENSDINIPPFLIASITSQCNLHCAGCYARANHACNDTEQSGVLTCDEWGKIFDEAGEIGVSFILLAGGEPTVRRDVLTRAAQVKNVVFPIFTNGTGFDSDYFELLDKNRNLIPIISMEGGAEKTDARRGVGMYDKISNTMSELKKRGILYGASVTVTRENMAEVISLEFTKKLEDDGCKVVIYVEYVPVNENTKDLAITDDDREILKANISRLKESSPIVFISFPGDEKTSGGCLAAGRGFFHINPHGGAEPCPFSPFSDTNIRGKSLLEAIDSKLFAQLRDTGVLENEHIGGCVLYEQREKVKSLV